MESMAIPMVNFRAYRLAIEKYQRPMGAPKALPRTKLKNICGWINRQCLLTMNTWLITAMANVISTVSLTLKIVSRKGVATMTKPTPAMDWEKDAQAITMLA